MVYELRVPLRESAQHQFAIGATESKNIGIGFMTGELEMPAMPGDRGFGPPAGGMPPAGVAPGGGDLYGGMPREGQAGSEPIDLWITARMGRGK
jgi:hypothetical protein